MQGLPVSSLVRTSCQHSSTDEAPPTSKATYLPARMAATAMRACVCHEVKIMTASMSARLTASR